MHAVYPSAGRAAAMFRRTPRVHALALCLSAALAVPAAIHPALAAPNPPWIVENCTDHDTNSLRDIVQNKAQSGDIIDLSQVPTRCGAANSKITLTTGEIAIPQDTLTLQGPDRSEGTVTISGGGTLRVLDHQGSGTLFIQSLTISDGFYHLAGNAYGGCVKSSANVSLQSTVVSNCIASSDAGSARGGGIYAFKDVGLVSSTVSGNQTIVGSVGNSQGGGISTRIGSFSAKYSSVSNNVADGGPFHNGMSGGVDVLGTMTIFASTINDNKASSFGAAFSRGSTIILNSTISGNIADRYDTALYTKSDSLTIANSTIAFNRSQIAGSAAVRFHGASASSVLTLQNSIIANNTMGSDDEPSDLYLMSGSGTLSGADNLVVASNVSDPAVITIVADPKLGPLQSNGGRTLTHALLSGSPAIGAGNVNVVPPGLMNDQRGTGYPRTTGPSNTVDIGAVQFDTIFVSDFDLVL
jgi:hypothetical protein